MKNEKGYLSMLLAMLILFSFVACSGRNTSSSSTVAPKGSIEFWTMFIGSDGGNMQAIVDAYNATNPAYTVNHRIIEADQLYMNLPLAIQSGQDVPDIVINHIERIPVFQENGFYTDLAPLMAAAGIDPASYNQLALNMSNFGGKQWGIPLDVHTFITYVNMDLYEKYGNGALDDNVLTWDEVKAVGDTTAADGISATAITWKRACWLSSYAQLGGTLSMDGMEPSFNNDQAKEVFSLWKELDAAGYVPKEGDVPWDMFLGGKVMYCPESTGMYGGALESGINFKMYNFPVFEKDTLGNWASSHQFVIPADKSRPAEEQAAAMDFINYVGNNSIEWAKAGQVPAQDSIKASAEFQTMPQAFLADYTDELKIYDYRYYGWAVESLDKIFDNVLYGRTTADAGLTAAERETKDRIEQEN